MVCHVTLVSTEETPYHTKQQACMITKPIQTWEYTHQNSKEMCYNTIRSQKHQPADIATKIYILPVHCNIASDYHISLRQIDNAKIDTQQLSSANNRTTLPTTPKTPWDSTHILLYRTSDNHQPNLWVHERAENHVNTKHSRPTCLSTSTMMCTMYMLLLTSSVIGIRSDSRTCKQVHQHK